MLMNNTTLKDQIDALSIQNVKELDNALDLVGAEEIVDVMIELDEKETETQTQLPYQMALIG